MEFGVEFQGPETAFFSMLDGDFVGNFRKC